MEISRELLSEIIQEAHTMGRMYSDSGEKLNPADQFERVETMANDRLSAYQRSAKADKRKPCKFKTECRFDFDDCVMVCRYYIPLAS